MSSVAYGIFNADDILIFQFTIVTLSNQKTLSACNWQTVHMKCQDFFTLKNEKKKKKKKKKFRMLSALNLG